MFLDSMAYLLCPVFTYFYMVIVLLLQKINKTKTKKSSSLIKLTAGDLKSQEIFLNLVDQIIQNWIYYIGNAVIRRRVTVCPTPPVLLNL